MMMLSPILVSVALLGAPEGRELVDRIVAVVNDDVIIGSELDEAVSRVAAGDSAKRQILEDLINEKLMEQQIAEAKINVSETDLDRAVADILRTNNITEAELQAAIDARGMSMKQYRKDLRAQLIRLKLIDAKVRSRVVIPEAEIKAEYERQSRAEAKEEMVTIRHIFLRWSDANSAKAKAETIQAALAARQRVLDGEDFQAVAKELSEGPTASAGGDLGEMNRKQMLPELAKGIEGLKAGELTMPLETDTGVHVVLLESTRAQGSSTYADSRSKIYQTLYQREIEAQMQVWLEELRKQAAVSILL